MTARIVQFPIQRRMPFAVHIVREAEAWLVLCRDYGWLHGDRAAAIAEARALARGFGVVVSHSPQTQYFNKNNRIQND
jgi:hypothetical protein